MSATNLDLPLLISAAQIRRREFVTIRRGYDPDQVRDYLEQIADQVDQMQSLLREARVEADTAARASETPKVDPYEQLAHRVSDLIREADDAAEQIRSAAREDAERMTREARADADRVRTDAQSRAEETRAAAEDASREARAETDRALTDLVARRDALVEQLASMQERALAVARDLARAIDLEPDEPAEPEASGSAGTDAAEAEPIPAQADPPTTDDPSSKPADPAVSDAVATLDDPAYEELLEATESMQLDLPDIPPLDLDWGEDPEDDHRD